MRVNGRVLFSLCVMALAGCAVLAARQWPVKAALFPLATGIPLLLLATAQLITDVRGESEGSGGPTLDLELSADVPPEIARRRTVAMFSWTAGFILLVFLIGFPLTVPVFVLAYLAPQRDLSWRLKLGLTAGAWGFFHGLFERVLQLPFEAGRIQTWLGF
ncbi:MAG TPA: tripartite tricarboxylate transporter TctB family protein [Candidatus Methylomirabilis sp.]|nr:tripartite tricarboxylate transporter TctB family protein [Candidatus Methylomirabilis sp.]